MTGMSTRLATMPTEKRTYILEELCRHLVSADRHQESASLLSNLEFLAHRCMHGGIDAIIADLEATRSVANGASIADPTFEKFARFIVRRAHALRSDPHGIWQEALNFDEPAVARAAEDLASSNLPSGAVWLRRLTDLAGEMHSGAIVSLLFWDKELVVSTTNREVWLWDLQAGRVRWRFDSPPSAAKSLQVSPNGQRLAAAFGSREPSPLIAGARVWERSGSTSTTAWLPVWAYSVSWVGDESLIVGGGLPRGSEAEGRIWRLSVDSGYRSEVGGWIADKPIVLAWELSAPDAGTVMAVSKDGYLLRIEPSYIPIAPSELKGIDDLETLSSFHRDQPDEVSDEEWEQEQEEEFLELETKYYRRDRWMETRRPVVTRVAAPVVDNLGLLTTAVVGPGDRSVTVLGGPPPLSATFEMFHRDLADAIYRLDFEDGVFLRVPFGEDNLSRGVEVLCVDVSPQGDIAAVGLRGGYAYIMPLVPDSSFDRMFVQVHDGEAPVTAVRFNEASNELAVGDAAGHIVVYDVRSDQRQTFRTATLSRAVNAYGTAQDHLVLFRDHLQSTRGANTDSLSWELDMVGVDFAISSSLIVILLLPADSQKPDDAYGDWIECAELVIAKRLDFDKFVRVRVPIPRWADRDVVGPPFKKISIHCDSQGCDAYLGSTLGVWRLPLFAPDGGRLYTIPADRRERERNIYVMNRDHGYELEFDGLVRSDDSERVIGMVIDQANHPLPVGELHGFDVRTGAHELIMRLAGEIKDAQFLGATLIVGTEDGTATAIRRRADGWERLGERLHGNAVVAVFLSVDESIAVSASRDGQIVAWHVEDQSSVFGTFIDSEPMHIDMSMDHLCVTDIFGSTHEWVIEGDLGNAALKHVISRSEDQYGEVLEVITAADRLNGYAAQTLLDSLPEVPDREEIRAFWVVLVGAADPTGD